MLLTIIAISVFCFLIASLVLLLQKPFLLGFLLRLLPRLPGSDRALTRVELIRDGESADLGAAGESALGMVELGALDAGKTQRIALLEETLAPGEHRTYLVVGDLSAEIGSMDEVRVDIVGVAAGKGVLSGLVPVIDGVPLAGPGHVATGYIEESAVQFDQVEVAVTWSHQVIT